MTDKKVREELVYNEWLDRAYNVYLHKRRETTTALMENETYSNAIRLHGLNAKLKQLN